MVEYGHGSHLDCVTTAEQLLEKHLVSLIETGRADENANVRGIFFDNTFPTTEEVFSITGSDEELDVSALALIVADHESKTNEFFTVYPYVDTGDVYSLTIESILEWPNQFEAVLATTTNNGHSISFFDTKYFANKDKYEIGKSYEFCLSALAYTAEILRERSFSFEGQKAIDFLAKTGRQPEIDDDGNVRPVVFGLSDLVAYLPRNDPFPDDCEFQSPIKYVAPAKSFDKSLYRLSITIFRDPEISIDLFAKEEFFETPPEVGDPVRGVLWMQGFLI